MKKWEEENIRIKRDIDKYGYSPSGVDKIIYMLYHVIVLLCKILYKDDES